MGGQESKPTHFSYIREGETSLNEGRPEDALSQFNQAIEAQPMYYLAYLARGKCFVTLERYGDALSDFDTALSIDDSCHAARLHKANCLEELGEFEEAVMERSRVPREVRRQADDHQRRVALSRNHHPHHPLQRQHTSKKELKIVARSGNTPLSPSKKGSFSRKGASPLIEDGETNSACTTTEDTTSFMGAEEDYGSPQMYVDGDESVGTVVRRGDIVDAEDHKRFEYYRNKWAAEEQRGRNIHDFLHGKRGMYVQSASVKKEASTRADRQAQMSYYDMQRHGKYSRVGSH